MDRCNDIREHKDVKHAEETIFSHEDIQELPPSEDIEKVLRQPGDEKTTAMKGASMTEDKPMIAYLHNLSPMKKS